MKVTINKKVKGYDLKLGEGAATNYSSLFKLAKALMLYAKGQKL